jgi:hypothetical protein
MQPENTFASGKWSHYATQERPDLTSHFCAHDALGSRGSA